MNLFSGIGEVRMVDAEGVVLNVIGPARDLVRPVMFCYNNNGVVSQAEHLLKGDMVVFWGMSTHGKVIDTGADLLFVQGGTLLQIELLPDFEGDGEATGGRRKRMRPDERAVALRAAAEARRHQEAKRKAAQAAALKALEEAQAEAIRPRPRRPR